MEPSTESLVAACQSGDMNSFSALYDRFVEPIYRFVYYKTWHRETAEDITSQTFLRALDRIHTFQSRKGNFSAWLYRIARNLVVDHYRRQHPSLPIEDVWGLAQPGDVRDAVDQRELLQKVSAYLDQLNPLQREIVMLRLWENLSYREISGIVGKSEANCKVIYSRTIACMGKEIITACLLLITYMLHI